MNHDDTQYLNPLSDLLMAGRIEAGLDKSAAGELIGVSVSTIMDWERGVWLPKLDKREAICSAYPSITEQEFNHAYFRACKQRGAEGAKSPQIAHNAPPDGGETA